MPDAIRSIEEYAGRLRAELAGADPALIQDAVYDATFHLRTETDALAAERPDSTPEERLALVVERFGSPEEVADAYRRTEATVAAALAPPRREEPRTALARVFGVFTDPHTYGSLFYMFLSLATGIVQFTFVTTGIALSLGLSILIIGIPFVLFFIAMTRVLSLVEGRIVEVLLGERMPRRPLPAARGTIGQRIVLWLKDPRTWSTMLYMLLHLPLGVFYFALFTTLLSLSAGIAIAPVAEYVTGHPAIFTSDGAEWVIAWWAAPLVWLGAFALLLLTLHLARALGTLHGRLAKVMLVRPAERERTSPVAAGVVASA